MDHAWLLGFHWRRENIISGGQNTNWQTFTLRIHDPNMVKHALIYFLQQRQFHLVKPIRGLIVSQRLPTPKQHALEHIAIAEEIRAPFTAIITGDERVQILVGPTHVTTLDIDPLDACLALAKSGNHATLLCPVHRYIAGGKAERGATSIGSDLHRRSTIGVINQNHRHTSLGGVSARPAPCLGSRSRADHKKKRRDGWL